MFRVLLLVLLNVWMDSSAWGCVDVLSERLSVPLQNIERFSAERMPYSLQLARVRHDLYQFSKISDDGECVGLLRGRLGAFEDFIERRFRTLIASGDQESILTYFDEVRFDRLYRDDAELRPFLDRMQRLEPNLLTALRENLRTILAGSGLWSHYAALNFEITGWNNEWSEALGRDANAAVDRNSGRVAIRTDRLGFDDLMLLLFHEWAHLADSYRRVTCLERMSGEKYAWSETMRFSFWFENEFGRTIPRWMRSIRTLNQTDEDLARFVLGIFSSREGECYRSTLFPNRQ